MPSKSRQSPLIPMDEIHAKIHAGLLFTVSRVNTALAAAGSELLLFTVPTGVTCHARFRADALNAARLTISETPTTSAAGTAVAARNRNRASTQTAVTVVTHTPTVSADGTVLEDRVLAWSLTGSDYHEFIFAPGTYLVRLTNLDAAAQPLSVNVDFYEIENSTG